MQNPPIPDGRAAEAERPVDPVLGLVQLSKALLRIEGCAELGTHSPQGPTRVFSILAPLGSIQAEKRSGFFVFVLFCFLVSICLMCLAGS